MSSINLLENVLGLGLEVGDCILLKKFFEGKIMYMIKFHKIS
jgi:hypothetical protein